MHNFISNTNIRKVQENQVGLKLNGTHQLMTYANDINLLADNIPTINKKRKLIKYWKTSVRNTVFLVLDFIVHFSHYLALKNTVLCTEVFQYLIDTCATGCITQLLKKRKL
jgi:hypothetical protein